MIYSTPPLAGRPPFATDEPDELYQQRTAQPRLRQQPPPDPNARSSAYNMYDQYLDEKSDAPPAPRSTNPFDDMFQTPAHAPIPLAAPRPGYAAPIAALNLAQPARAASPGHGGRSPTSQPGTPEMSQAYPKPLTLVSRQGTPSVPSTPHPLQPPMTPIAPAFIRPSSAASRDIKFASEPIMRGDDEDTVLPRQGQPRGEDFWRRFSMVAHTEKPNAKSTWLNKTMSGTSRMSRTVFVIGMILFVIVVGAICLGVYIAHKNTKPASPEAIGGSAEETAAAAPTTIVKGGMATSTFFHVTPTNTVARRSAGPQPTATIPQVVATPVADNATQGAEDSPEWLHVVEGWLGLYSGAASPVDDEADKQPTNESVDTADAGDFVDADTPSLARRDGDIARAYTKAHPGPQARHRRAHLNRSL